MIEFTLDYFLFDIDRKFHLKLNVGYLYYMGFKMYERIENDKYLDVKQEQCM